MIRGNDFILNPNNLEEQFQLVEVSNWVDFTTKEKLGFYYTVLFPKLKFEKVKVAVKITPLICLRRRATLSVIMTEKKLKEQTLQMHLKR